jgi:glycosyltransferase involved in cell wall biosynthesis
MAVQTKVDILLSFKNNRPFLKDALNCISKQSRQDYHLYICDDASTDQGANVVEEFMNARTSFIRNETSMGLAVSLNKLASMGSSPYLMRMDGDDLCHPERMERQLRWFDENSRAGILGTRYDWIFSSGKLYKTPKFPLDKKLLPLIEKGHSPLAHATIMMPRKIFEKVGGYRPESGTAEDFDLYLRIASHASLHIYPEYLYSWRVHPYSTVTREMESNRQFLEEIFGARFASSNDAAAGLRQWARRIAADGFKFEALLFMKEALRMNFFSSLNWKFIINILLGQAQKDSVVSWYDE